MKSGYVLDRFPVAEQVRAWVEARRWREVDAAVAELVAPGGALFVYLQRYHPFTSIEFILSIRDSADPDQEDGIWHDDGSRFLAFTLSLTPDAAALEGGMLGIRQKGATEHVLLPTPAFGHMIVYLTGHYGYEHRIHRVARGCRVVIAGWCSGTP